jgi:hypothetical protein
MAIELGYIQVLQDARSLFPAIPSIHTNASATTYSLCMGANWHRFQSHFFLPAHVHLHYIQDHFGGLLPQPFGQFAYSKPSKQVNDRNAEELDRYTPLAECDYLLVSIESSQADMMDRKICSDVLLKHFINPQHYGLSDELFRVDPRGCEDHFMVVSHVPVLAYHVQEENSVGRLHRLLKVLARAYYIPFLSRSLASQTQYSLLQHHHSSRVSSSEMADT